MIERKTEQGYEEFMKSVLRYAGIEQMRIGRTRKKELSPEEVSVPTQMLVIISSPPPKSHQRLQAALCTA